MSSSSDRNQFRDSKSQPNAVPGGHYPNLTVTDASKWPEDRLPTHATYGVTSDPNNLPPTAPGSGQLPIPRPKNPNAPTHPQPRVFFHQPSTTSQEEAEQAYKNTSFLEGLRMISWDSVKNFKYQPCVRDAFLPAIPIGCGVGALRFILGGSVYAATMWSGGSGLVVSEVMYYQCQKRRKYEKDGIRKIVKALEEKEVEKKKLAEEQQQQKAMQKAEEEERRKIEQSQWYNKIKFW